MQFGFWDTLFNLFLLILWTEFWMGGHRMVAFNQYLAPASSLTGKIVEFLKPVFFGLSRRAILVTVILFTIVFRALVVQGRTAWVVTSGFSQQVDPSDTGACIAFSFLSFAAFLFKIWCVSTIFVRSDHAIPSGQTTSALYAVAQPFTLLRSALRPPVLLVLGMAIAVGLDAVGGPVKDPVPGIHLVSGSLGWGLSSGVVVTIRVMILSLMAWAQVLPVLQSLMLLMIIGSWISMFTGSNGLSYMCRDWMNLLLGPLRRYPLRIGMFDLSPIVFFFAVGFAHRLLLGVLVASLNKL